MNVYFINIETTEKLMREVNLTKNASHNINIRMIRSSNVERKKHIFGSSVLLKFVLFEHNVPLLPNQITYNSYGKPFINKGYYNISHSNEWIMCVYHSVNIGVDVEEQTHVNLGLAEHFFMQDEYNYLLRLRLNEQLEYFFNTWTFKESYVKNKGISLFDIKNKIGAPRKVSYFQRQEIRINNDNYYYIMGYLNNYKWCIFSHELQPQVYVKIVKHKDLKKILPTLCLE